jgi:hypothetical protein
MLNFVSKTLEDGVFQHSVMMGEEKIDEFKNYNETTNAELYVNEVGFPARKDVIEHLTAEGILKRYDKLNKNEEGKYECRIINKIEKVPVTEFVVKGKTKMPDTVIIKQHDDTDVIKVNSILPSLLNKIEGGYLIKSADPVDDGLTIELPYDFVEQHFKYDTKDTADNFKRMVKALIK